MRNKKAKQIRRVLRQQGIGTGTTKYMQMEGTERLKPIKNAEGKVVSTYPTVTIMLDPSCGRAVYQQTKQVVKQIKAL